MVQILSWTNLADDLKLQLQQKSKKYFWNKPVYMAIIFVWNNTSSRVYVEKKKQYWLDIWIQVKIIDQEYIDNFKLEKINIENKKTIESQDYNKVIQIINFLNNDVNCVWIIVQLPLTETLQKYKSQILARVKPKKDIDWLGGVLLGLSSIDLIDFLPATPKSVFYLLDKYNLWNIAWKKVCVLWQSNLAWKPIVLEAIKRGGLVTSLNNLSDIENTRKITKESDYIISCTWQINLIDSSFLRSDCSQIVVDVWYGHINWKPVWDVNIESVKDNVLAYTPVPGWVWPLTVACLFDNIFDLQDMEVI